MLFMNTDVTRGRGTMVVTATGMQTEIGAIATLLVDDGFDGLVDGLGLAGERGLGDLQPRGPDDPAVGGHGVAGLEQHDVAGHEFGARQVLFTAVAADAGGVDRHLSQRLQAVLGPALLHVVQDGVEGDDGEDDDGGLPFARDHGADHGGDDEDEGHPVGEQGEHLAPAGYGCRFGEGVGPVLTPALLDDVGGQPGRGVDVECRRDVVGVAGVPRGGQGHLARSSVG
ncbi:hypothetical protein AIIKEEIJ_05879 [Rhodococcus sp. YH1]|nr:hypothetical protein [Rhodococcus sp. YH1]